VYYDPRTEPHNLAHNPLTSLVVPRPIGWISTMGPGGTVNLAPYSFFNMVSALPPFVLFGSNPKKHSQANAEARGEFVVSMATLELCEYVNQTGAPYAPEVSEPQAVGLDMLPSRNVKPPRVARSPVALECKYFKTVDLVPSNGKPSDSAIIIGEVVGIYIDDAYISKGMVDYVRMAPLARLGYLDYGVVERVFPMVMPGYAPIANDDGTT